MGVLVLGGGGAAAWAREWNRWAGQGQGLGGGGVGEGALERRKRHQHRLLRSDGRGNPHPRGERKEVGRWEEVCVCVGVS